MTDAGALEPTVAATYPRLQVESILAREISLRIVKEDRFRIVLLNSGLDAILLLRLVPSVSCFVAEPTLHRDHQMRQSRAPAHLHAWGLARDEQARHCVTAALTSACLGFGIN